MSDKQSQEYRGNGKHEWEKVVSKASPDGYHHTQRLRVPGGWLYQTSMLVDLTDQGDGVLNTLNTVFVPMPEVVKHEV